MATVIVTHYYFKRSVSKSLGVYGLLNSYVLAGIAADVRRQLHFRFHDREVHELQQLVFLVANDGEKAIRDLMEPLCLTLPSDIALLDASIIHRWPEALAVNLETSDSDSGSQTVQLEFPLLNKREFFVVKLLLSGQLRSEHVRFSLLAEDLPRSLHVKPVPPKTIQEASYKIEWGMASFGVATVLFALWLGRSIYLLYRARPDLFPIPWPTFKLSIDAVLLLLPAIVVIPLLVLLGLVILAAAAFGGEFPPQRGPRFPLPKELREAVFPFGLGIELGLKPTAWSDPAKETRPSISTTAESEHLDSAKAIVREGSRYGDHS